MYVYISVGLNRCMCNIGGGLGWFNGSGSVGRVAIATPDAIGVDVTHRCKGKTPWEEERYLGLGVDIVGYSLRLGNIACDKGVFILL